MSRLNEPIGYGPAGGMGGQTIRLADQPFGTALKDVRTQLHGSRSLSNVDETTSSLDILLDSSARTSLVVPLGGVTPPAPPPRQAAVEPDQDLLPPPSRIHRGQKRSSVHALYVQKLRQGVHYRKRPIEEVIEQGRARVGLPEARTHAVAPHPCIHTARTGLLSALPFCPLHAHIWPWYNVPSGPQRLYYV